MNLAIAFNTMNKVDLTKQTFPVLRDGKHALIWSDGSTDYEALGFFEQNRVYATESYPGVTGGADLALVHALTRLLQNQNYTHVGLVESDVLLDSDWLEPTLDLFEIGKRDGFDVGAVSARSYVDRVLIQRDGYACMHNLGAGMVIFTREAAEIVLHTFRTGWWADNVRLFGQLAGIDLRTYAAFRGNQQWVTSDWTWDAQLAAHGLASLALTPAKVQMVGQNPPLKQQGLELTTGSPDERRGNYHQYRESLEAIRARLLRVDFAGAIPRMGDTQIFFPHMVSHLLGAEWKGNLEHQWSQGFSPIAYRAGPGGASLSVLVSGTCSVLATGGFAGAKVTVEDRRSGFKAQPDLPGETQVVEIAVPGGPILRRIDVAFDEGAVFYGLSTSEPQPIDTTFKFDWSQLPEAK